MLIAKYIYTDEEGKPLYTVYRYDPKRFAVRVERGRLLDQTGRYPRVPYRLPELMAADPIRPVFVVEGEKDVERLRAEGEIATCNAFGGGKNKWTRGHGRALRGREVIIIPDNDATGREHAACVATALRRVARQTKVVELSGVKYKGDVSDWLEQHSIEELRKLADSTCAWTGKSENESLVPPDLRSQKWEDEYFSLKVSRRERLKIYGLPISAPQKLLVMMLSEFADKSQSNLSDYLGVTPRRVRQMLKELLDAGIVDTFRLRKGRKHYMVHEKFGNTP